MVTIPYKTLSITIKTQNFPHSLLIYMFGITVTVNNYCPARQVSPMEDTIISLWRTNRVFTCCLDQFTFEVFDAIALCAVPIGLTIRDTNLNNFFFCWSK